MIVLKFLRTDDNVRECVGGLFVGVWRRKVHVLAGLLGSDRFPWEPYTE